MRSWVRIRIATSCSHVSFLGDHWGSSLELRSYVLSAGGLPVLVSFITHSEIQWPCEFKKKYGALCGYILLNLNKYNLWVNKHTCTGVSATARNAHSLMFIFMWGFIYIKQILLSVLIPESWLGSIWLQSYHSLNMYIFQTPFSQNMHLCACLIQNYHKKKLWKIIQFCLLFYIQQRLHFHKI